MYIGNDIRQLLQQKQLAAYAANNTFITGDLVVDLHTFDQFYWERAHRLYWRQRVLISYLSTLCGYLSVLEPPLFTRAVRIIRRLASIGCLEEVHIPAEALLRLWESPEKLFSIYLTAPKRGIIAEQEGVEADEKKLSE